MADPPVYPVTDTEDNSGVRPDRGSTAGTPRWMFVLGIVIAVLVVLVFVLLHLTGAIGPGLHSR